MTLLLLPCFADGTHQWHAYHRTFALAAPSGWYILPPNFHMVYFLRSGLRWAPHWPSPLHHSMVPLLGFMFLRLLRPHDLWHIYLLLSSSPPPWEYKFPEVKEFVILSMAMSPVSELYCLLLTRCSNIIFEMNEFCTWSPEHNAKPRSGCNKSLFTCSKSWIEWLRSWNGLFQGIWAAVTLWGEKCKECPIWLLLLLLVEQGLGLARLMGIGVLWPRCLLLSPFNSLLLGDTFPPSPNTVPLLNCLLPWLFEFKGEPGRRKPVKIKGPPFSYTHFLLELHFSLLPSFSMLPSEWIACCTPNAFCHLWAVVYAVLSAWNTLPPFCPLSRPVPANSRSSFKTQLRFPLGSTHGLPP